LPQNAVELDENLKKNRKEDQPLYVDKDYCI